MVEYACFTLRESQILPYFPYRVHRLSLDYLYDACVLPRHSPPEASPPPVRQRLRGGVPGPPRHSDRPSLIAFVCSDHSYLRVYGALVTELPRGRKGEWDEDSVPEGVPIRQGKTGV